MKKIIHDNLRYFIAVVLGFVALIAFVLGITWIVVSALAPPDINKAEKILETDGDLLETVVSYLENSDESIYIHKTVSYNKIENETVMKAINQLFKRKYDTIGKNGNTIYFLRWTRWRDFGAGLAYTINETEEPVIDYLIKLEPLSKEQWYYYEAN